jgi:hypothetical protein
MNKRLVRARAEHDKWLKKRGLLPAQIKIRIGRPKLINNDTWNPSPMPKMNTSIEYTAGVNSIWEKIRKGEEKNETVQAIIAKSKRIAPAYSKGPVQYLGDDPDVIRNAGKKNAV